MHSNLAMAVGGTDLVRNLIFDHVPDAAEQVLQLQLLTRVLVMWLLMLMLMTGADAGARDVATTNSKVLCGLCALLLTCFGRVRRLSCMRSTGCRSRCVLTMFDAPAADAAVATLADEYARF